MVSGDIYHKSFDEICELCRKYSRSKDKTRRSVRDGFSRASRSINTTGVTRMELGKLLENFKTDIMGTLTSQFDALETKKRQEEEDATLQIFCPKCRKRHPLKECPLNTIVVCALCTKKHSTESCLALPKIQPIYKISTEASEQSYAPKRPWPPRPQNQYPDSAYQNPAYYYPMQPTWNPQACPN